LIWKTVLWREAVVEGLELVIIAILPYKALLDLEALLYAKVDETLAWLTFPSSPNPYSQNGSRGAGKLHPTSPSPFLGQGDCWCSLPRGLGGEGRSA
jgi:hypothetical protein